MRLRKVVAALAGMLLVATGCAKEKEAVEPTTAEPVIRSETTIKSCVNDLGTIPPAEATGTEFTTLKPKVLTIGSDTAFAPFESIDNGKVVGFDVDIMNEVAKRLGDYKADFQTAGFDTIFTALASGKFDVVVSAVTIKAERKKTVDFTDPYFNADQSLSVRTADAEKIKGVDYLKGRVIGVQAGTTGKDCADNALKAKGKVKDVKAYETAPEAFNDLAAKRIDGVLIDLPVAKQNVAASGKAVLVQAILTSEDYGIAVSKKNPNLREAINKVLKAMQDDGTYARIYKKTFKTEPPA